MSSVRCPRCKQSIGEQDVNVSTDVAFCRACNVPHPFSSLAQNVNLEASVNLDTPPSGCSYHQHGEVTVAIASARSWAGALGLLFFALFWNGIVSVFVALSTMSTLKLLGVPIPKWLFSPKNGASSLGVGMTIFLWLFLTPFIAVGLGMLAAFFHSLAGRCELRLNGDEGWVFTGVGPIGRRQHFSVREVRDVRMENRHWRDSDGDARNKAQVVIELHSGHRLTFASGLPPKRRQFLALAAKRALGQ